MKRFVAQAETPNGEIDLVDRALAPPAERHSKLLCKMSAMIRESCKRLQFMHNAVRTRDVPNRSGRG